ncbi:hypothetical protein ACM1RC_04735 [Paenibacillus azoreducens]|uniref:hypothetical protein n=1 Tax=Paenibacillus azoreducens TaxID=116718 RepID=UPI0039F4D1C1
MTKLSISDDLKLLSEELQQCLCPQALRQLAKEVERASLPTGGGALSVGMLFQFPVLVPV